MKSLLAALLLAVSARADVREIKSMAEIVPSLDTSTLLVFDIDNTLVEPVGNIGSDQWYYYLVKAVARDDKTLTADQAEEKAGAIWTRELDRIVPKPVEALTPALVREQQKRGLKVMALTARGASDAPATFRQLEKIGVDMTAAAVRKDDLSTEQKGLYSRGVFFVGEGPDKGKTLASFLKKIGLRPKRVVFVDDKPHHVKNMDAAMAAEGIPSVSFRYGAADAKVNAFNEVMGEASSDAGAAAMLFFGREPAK